MKTKEIKNNLPNELAESISSVLRNTYNTFPIRVIETMIVAGANINHITKDGMTLISQAMIHKRDLVVELFLEYDADIFIADNGGKDFIEHYIDAVKTHKHYVMNSINLLILKKHPEVYPRIKDCLNRKIQEIFEKKYPHIVSSSELNLL